MPLTILIAGAGIVGLASTIPLSEAGHTVHIFERSAMSTEFGAAFHFGPNATRILRRWKFDIKALQPVLCETWSNIDWNGKILTVTDLQCKKDLEPKKKELGVVDDEIMIHRVDAHKKLREQAMSSPNVHLHLSSKVVSADAVAGSFTLADGSVHTGDLLIGADGVHSLTVRAIAEDLEPCRLGINMYRFMIPAKIARADEKVNALLDKLHFDTTHNGIFEPEGQGGTGKLLVVYPCRNRDLLNVATFQPENLDDVKMTTEWTNPGKMEDVLRLFEAWPEEYKSLIRLAEDARHWALVTRDIAPTYVKNKLVLVGDAAHPTQPTYGAGAAMGLEDAAVLGVLLDSTANVHNLSDRLALYNELRYERSATIKYASEMTRPTWQDAPDSTLTLLRKFVPDGKFPKDVVAYLWQLDVMEQAEQALRKLQK